MVMQAIIDDRVMLVMPMLVVLVKREIVQRTGSGQMDGPQMDGWWGVLGRAGWTDGQMEGRTDGQTWAPSES